MFSMTVLLSLLTANTGIVWSNKTHRMSHVWQVPQVNIKKWRLTQSANELVSGLGSAQCFKKHYMTEHEVLRH